MNCHLLMDCAYEGNETRQLALDLGFIPVVPPNPQRLQPWKLKKAWCRRRNEVAPREFGNQERMHVTDGEHSLRGGIRNLEIKLFLNGHDEFDGIETHAIVSPFS